MKFYKFVHSSMFGSYFVNCDAEFLGNGKVKVTYICPYQEIECSEVVDEKYVKERKLKELNIDEFRLVVNAYQEKMNAE